MSFSSPDNNTINNINTINYKSGNIYHGEVVNNRRHGYGVMTLVNGHTYKGEYKNDKRNGYGVYTFGEDCIDKYEGHFFENKRDGYGVYTYANGIIYTGSWRKNLKEGSGILTYPDGVVVKGIFFKGDICYGEIQFPNNSRYIGEIDSYLMNGRGTIIFSDGFEVTGQFINDEICIKEDEIVCCFCLTKDCENDCYEYFEGICGNPDVFSEENYSVAPAVVGGTSSPSDEDNFNIIQEGCRVTTKVIENDLIWSKAFQGIARKIRGRWVYVKFDDGDYLMVNKDLLERIQ